MANSNETKKKTTTTKKTSTKSSTTKPATKQNTTKSVKKTTKAPSKAKTTTKTEVKKEPVKTPAIIQEENHFGRTILAAAIIVMIFFGGYLGIKYKMNGGTSTFYEASPDETKFKREYEELNGTTRENGDIIKNVTINKENHMVYIDVARAAEILDAESGIIYFGYAACSGCRNFAPVLIDAANAAGIKKIYYVDMRVDDKDENDIRDIYTLNDKNRARKVKDATDAYEDVKLILANYLKEYVLTTDDGRNVSTGGKRLYAPTVVAVNNGEVIGFQEGTGVENENEENGKLNDMSKEEETTLFNKFSTIFSDYLGNGCQEDGC